MFALSQSPSVAATTECLLSIGKWPDSVTATDWTSCFFPFLPSYLLRHTICLLLCDSPCEDAVIGRLVQLLTPKLIYTHAGISERQFSVCVSVCVCLTEQPGHKHHSVDCGNTEDTYALCCFCGSADRPTSGRRTLKVRGCSDWDVAVKPS